MDTALLLSILLLVLALVLGSFANVLIHRLPLGESIIAPRSHCPSCKTPLKTIDKIPVLSYFLLRGKCRFCSEEISIRYLIVEMLVAAISAPFIHHLIFLADWHFAANTFLSHSEFSMNLPPYLSFTPYLIFISPIIKVIFIEIFITITVALSFIDHKKHELPHELTYTGILLGLVYSFLFTNIQTSLVSIGLVFFIFDAVTHFANILYFKKKALLISPAALILRIDFLHKHITWVYLLYISAFAYLFWAQSINTLNILLLLIGISYIANDIFLDFFFLSPKAREESYFPDEDLHTVMGGGDAAMAALIASIISITSKSFMIIWLAFPIALGYVIGQKIISKFSSKSSKDDELSKRIPFGSSLAVALIIGMILTLEHIF